MKAIIAKDYGEPMQLIVADIEKPEPAEGQILVEVHAASVNPFDLKLISGSLRNAVPLDFPYTVGMDVAGVVAEAAPDVTRFKAGDKVFGMLREHAGAFAEYAVAKADGLMIAKVPDGLDLQAAAALPEVGLTAKTLLRTAQLQEGQTVFMIGATGGIGMVAVQLAKAAGAHVIATAGAEDAEYVRSLGAEETVDYKSGDAVVHLLKLHPDGVDVVVDVISMGDDVKHVCEAVKKGGRFVSSLQGPDSKSFGRDDMTASYIYLDAQPGDLDDLASRAASGGFRVEIEQTYPLEQTGQALDDLGKAHTRGKRVIVVRQ